MRIQQRCETADPTRPARIDYSTRPPEGAPCRCAFLISEVKFVGRLARIPQDGVLLSVGIAPETVRLSRSGDAPTHRG